MKQYKEHKYAGYKLATHIQYISDDTSFTPNLDVKGQVAFTAIGIYCPCARSVIFKNDGEWAHCPCGRKFRWIAMVEIAE